MEGVNPLYFPKFSFEPAVSDILAPLHFFSGVKITDFIDHDVTVKRA